MTSEEGTRKGNKQTSRKGEQPLAPTQQSGGVNIEGDVGPVGGDIVGHDKFGGNQVAGNKIIICGGSEELARQMAALQLQRKPQPLRVLAVIAAPVAGRTDFAPAPAALSGRAEWAWEMRDEDISQRAIVGDALGLREFWGVRGYWALRAEWMQKAVELANEEQEDDEDLLNKHANNLHHAAIILATGHDPLPAITRHHRRAGRCGWQGRHAE